MDPEDDEARRLEEEIRQLRAEKLQIVQAARQQIADAIEAINDRRLQHDELLQVLRNAAAEWERIIADLEDTA